MSDCCPPDMGITAAELAALQAGAEASMVDTAQWLHYSESTNDGAGGRTEGWSVTPDPATALPTIPCKINGSAPALFMQSGQQLAPVDIYFRGAVPLRIGLGVRDRLMVQSETYEVVDMDDPPTMLTQRRFGCRRIT